MLKIQKGLHFFKFVTCIPFIIFYNHKRNCEVLTGLSDVLNTRRAKEKNGKLEKKN